MFASGYRPYTPGSKNIYSNRAGDGALKLADEIGVLKREKQNLIQEKSLLKAKIARLTTRAKKPQSFATNSAVQNSLERELHQIEQMTANYRSEIALIKQSDRAAIIDELQEECLMLHMELIRMRSKKSEAEKENKDLQQLLQEKQSEFSREVLSKQKKEIKSLQKEIALQQSRNEIIAEKVQKRENAKDQPDERVRVISSTISDLDQKIKNEEDETEKSKQEIKRIQEEQGARIKLLEDRLKSLN
ncbi:hypothetical protein TVAG_038180 [Trichomonas vaginalis G3]|uniref:Uncharacterized protein n=1 Tax=Trichomonas vaginalis (strain ATCC PRA-98 / G3) TaxID=412133 RepID=A2DXX6_TRIV3|nr:hypothetical protein TVAGG3_0961120 [Trichomonas vaginalis G3]EAY14712.1 hypothetical protein TVAG_038180 [Trichomonas vaginalis G3]KAI5487917.1 hypothetical protein TVAGG3_0961120 [Trichomonas vaginalis G3]|eukprot:XP_001326935.1 hypothetical protein [Trichomonas vaginalis G3]